MKFATTLCITISLAVPGSLAGQAIVGYGANVGRAGTVGAATGASAAGVFSGLKGSLHENDKKSVATAPRQGNVGSRAEEEAEPQGDYKQILAGGTQTAGERSETTGSENSGTFTTANGIVISGLGRRTLRWADEGPSPGLGRKRSLPEPAANNPSSESEALSADTGLPTTGPQGQGALATGGASEPQVTGSGSDQGFWTDPPVPQPHVSQAPAPCRLPPENLSEPALGERPTPSQRQAGRGEQEAASEIVAALPNPRNDGPYCIQIAALRDPGRATQLADQLLLGGYPATIVFGDGIYRVLVGEYLTLADATAAAKELESAGYATWIRKIQFREESGVSTWGSIDPSR